MPLSGSYFYPGLNGNMGGEVAYNQVKVGDGHRIAEIDNMGIDSVNGTGYFVMIDANHHKIHEGAMFNASDSDPSVDVATPKQWMLVTPSSGANSNCFVHFFFVVEANKAVTLEFFEAPLISGSGSAFASYCNNRNCTMTSSVETYRDTTVNSSGTRLEVHYLGSASGSVPTSVTAGGAAEAKANEWILKPEEKYLLRITPEEDGTKVSLDFQYYITSLC